jgi:two-component system response regulator PilR (NtrC family)
MSSPAILIIDDEPDIRELLAMTVRRMGLDAFCAESLDGARRMLEKRRFDFCLTDMKLPDGTGLQLIEHVQQHHEGMPVAVITAFGSIELAIDSMKAGAFDFLSKPIDLERLRNLVSNALRLGEATATLQCPEQVQLLGDTEPMVQLRQQIVRLARSQAPVYISGESGTGKELVARLIHANGARAAGPFVPVNCGAIPGELMESEFFGHRKGSFTGAVADKQGLFQAANGGTLFLDEVADLPLPMQVKLLRAIQEKAVRAVGTEQEIRVDVRILSATHKNLAEEVEQGLFRRDLFYRINVIELRVPSLRERAADIALIAEACIRRLAEEYNTAAPRLHEDFFDLEEEDHIKNVLFKRCLLPMKANKWCSIHGIVDRKARVRRHSMEDPELVDFLVRHHGLKLKEKVPKSILLCDAHFTLEGQRLGRIHNPMK